MNSNLPPLRVRALRAQMRNHALNLREQTRPDFTRSWDHRTLVATASLECACSYRDMARREAARGGAK